jgi:ABC transport system ATP-binding/permease protein
MALIGIQNLTLSYGFPPLLDAVSLQVEEGDRLCLLGRNGAGKSTFLKVVAGLVEADGGEVSRSKGLRTAYLGQEFSGDLAGPALEVASEGDSSRMLASEQLLTLFGINPADRVEQLSGGQKRRVLLARVLASGADLLLLDEPTNHLDIDTILQLEDYLLRRVKSFLFVTHDRAFASRLANRVAEIDRGGIYSFDTTYDDFIRRREELLESEKRARDQFDKKMAEEELWLRKGVKARRTRNEGRVKALLAMREAYRLRRRREGSAKMEIHQGERTGKLVIETKNLTFGYELDGDPLVDRFTTAIMRGDRVGVVGPNGSGKTTLLKLLLAELSPLSGTVRHGVNLQPLYLDQMRSELDPDKSVLENIADGFETITMNGRKKHVIGYLKDFLFTPERAKSPVSHLSGGERNRLLLARLFAKPSNLLVLDEPTNDLDLETLELLEELLQEYDGTILLVSHDRSFLDNVVSDCFVLAGGGKVVEYAGGYSDWADSVMRRIMLEDEKASEVKTVPAAGGAPKPKSSRPRKLTFRENQELKQLPDTIADLEEEKDKLHGELADPDLYRDAALQDPDRDPATLTRRLENLEKSLEAAYLRRQELENIAAQASAQPD